MQSSFWKPIIRDKTGAVKGKVCAFPDFCPGARANAVRLTRIVFSLLLCYDYRQSGQGRDVRQVLREDAPSAPEATQKGNCHV